MEHEEQADRMEQDADKLEQHSEQLGERIDNVEDDWEQKEQDVSVPGAQPESAEDEESLSGVETDEDTTREEGGP
jgi:phage shock protein A